MKPGGGIWRAATAGTRALASVTGGRAPGCWREGLRRATGRLGAVPRSCAWMEPLTRRAPKLCSASLLGGSLSELVGHTVSPDPPEAKPRGERVAVGANAPSRGKGDRPCPVVTSELNGRGSNARKNGPSLVDAACAARLPKRANQTLVARCADEPRPARRALPSTQREVAPASNGAEALRRDIEANLERPRAATRAAYSDPAKPSAPRGGQLRVDSACSSEVFAQRLIDRVRCKLRRPALAAGAARWQSSDLIGAPWSTDLAGPTASASLVHRLAGVEPLGFSPAPTPRTGNENDSPRPLGRDRLSRETKGKTPVPALADGEWVRPRSERGESAPAASAEVGHRIADGGREEEPIAAPSFAEPLPPLAPPETGATGVLALAKEAARRGAREEATAPEDLDALAAKIQLILDEQARRHGIDV